MTPDFNKLVNSVQVDTVLTDILYQWANTPTGSTAALKKKWIPDHKRIANNLRIRYELDKESAEAYLERFRKLVEDASFDFDSGYLDATLPVNQYMGLNPVLKLQTLSWLASATPTEGQIVWLYCKLKDQWLQDSWSSYSDENRENSKKSFEKFSSLLKILFNSEPPPNRAGITLVLIKLGIVNELEWITSKTHKESRLFIFSSYLEDVAKNIDDYINIRGAI